MRYKVNSIKEFMRVTSLEHAFPLSVTVATWKKNRSRAQNRLLHKWAGIAAKQKGETPLEEKNYLKLTFAVPLLRQDSELNDFYSMCLDHLSYAQQIKAMTYIPATSHLGVRQFTVMLNHYEQECVRNGINLPHREDADYELAMGRSR